MCEAGQSLLFGVLRKREPLCEHIYCLCVCACVCVSGTRWIWVRPTSGISGIHISHARVYTANVCPLYVSAWPACAKESEDLNNPKIEEI